MLSLATTVFKATILVENAGLSLPDVCFGVAIFGCSGFSVVRPRTDAPIAPGLVRIVANLWASHIMLFIEMLLLVVAIRVYMQDSSLR